MGIFDRFFSRKAKELTYDQIADLIDSNGGYEVAGVPVTDKTALQVATVLACVKVISDGCATPNLHVYRELDDGTRQKATNIPEYRLLSRRPNEWQTSFEWRRQMTLHAALTGSALSIKVRGANRRVRELIPIMPGNWDVQRTSRYELVYRCWDEWGLIGTFAPDDVFVLNGVQWDWTKSLNAVRLAASSIGLAMASEKSQSAMHKNGMQTPGVYTVSGNLTEEQHTRLTKWLTRRYAGVENAGTPLVLDRDAKWTKISQTSSDAQHVETRRLQVEEICRAYGVFPIMVGHSDKSATFASSEAFFSAHVKHTLSPWHKAWTQKIDEMLLDGSGPLFAEFDVRYMMAGSMNDRAQWARAMVEMGIYTRNEVRDEEGKDPLPGLDSPLTPMNMTSGEVEDSPEDEAEDESEDDSEDDMEEVRNQLRAITAELRSIREMTLMQRSANPGQSPVNLKVDISSELDKKSGEIIQEVARETFKQIRKDIQEMPIVIPAPSVKVEAVMPEMAVPNVNVYNEVKPADVTVVDNHPVRAVQTVERDKDDEIVRTVTTYEKG